MNQMRLWMAASIIAIVLIVSFVLSVPHTRDVADTLPLQTATTSVPLITLHDAFKKGVHTITGSVEAPNACTLVIARASVVGDATSTQNIHLAISQSSDAGVCLQLPTRMKFSVTLAAPAELPITVTVNGLSATTSPS